MEPTSEPYPSLLCRCHISMVPYAIIGKPHDCLFSDCDFGMLFVKVMQKSFFCRQAFSRRDPLFVDFTHDDQGSKLLINLIKPCFAHLRFVLPDGGDQHVGRAVERDAGGADGRLPPPPLQRILLLAPNLRPQRAQGVPLLRRRPLPRTLGCNSKDIYDFGTTV